MSDPKSASVALVELVTCIGTWLGPVLGTVLPVLLTFFLNARSKRNCPHQTPDLEKNTPDELTGGLRTNGRIDRLWESLQEIFTSQDDMRASWTALQKEMRSSRTALRKEMRAYLTAMQEKINTFAAQVG